MSNHPIEIIRERAEQSFSKWQTATDSQERWFHMGEFLALKSTLNLLSIYDDYAVECFNALQAFQDEHTPAHASV